MKKGFTLVELLAVIVLISIISFIVVPNIINIFDKTREDVSSQQEEHFERLTKQYISEYSYEITFVSDVATVSLSDLKDAGYITGETKDPTSGDDYCDLSYIEITRIGDQYSYEVFLYKDTEGPCS